MEHLGGRLCGAVRLRVSTAPPWVISCVCHFCQRAIGTQGMIEPIYEFDGFAVYDRESSLYTHVSSGSGKNVHVHFCGNCGTKTHMTFERWLDRLWFIQARSMTRTGSRCRRTTPSISCWPAPPVGRSFQRASRLSLNTPPKPTARRSRPPCSPTCCICADASDLGITRALV